MIDTHCHLTDPQLFAQLADVVRRATTAGVDRLVTIGTDLEDDADAIALCRQHANVRCAVGIHPNNASGASVADVQLLRSMLADPTCVAIGETGLDFHYSDGPPHDHQRAIFEGQLSLAVEFNKPVVVHSRDAIGETLAVMKNFPNVRAVVHCFTGTAAEAEAVLAAGYLLGFTGIATYKNAEAIRQAIKLTPIERMLVETDSPYLSPEPVRKQKTCEPAFVVHTARAIADLRGITAEALDRVTTENAERFYGLVGRNF